MNTLPSDESFETTLNTFVTLPEDGLNDFYELHLSVLMQNKTCRWLRQKRINESAPAESESPSGQELFLVRKAVTILCLQLPNDQLVAFFTQTGEFLLYHEAIEYTTVLQADYKDHVDEIKFYEPFVRIYQEEGLEKVLAKVEYTLLKELTTAINSPAAAQNLSYKKELLEAAIQMKRVHPFNTANNKAILGAILIKMPEGDHGQNIDEAIIQLTESLSFFTREAYPFEWAQQTNHLGRAFYERTAGDPANNLAISIRYLLSAAEILKLRADDTSWASNNLNLGMAYQEAGQEHWNQSIACYTIALAIYEKLGRIPECAAITYSLGLLYYERKTDDDQDSLEKCVIAYEKSLRYNQALQNLKTCAGIQGALGIAYSFLQQPDYEVNIQKSIGYFNDAIAFFEAEKNGFALEELFFEAGDAYLHFKNKNQDENIETAMDCFHRGLQLTNRDAPNIPIFFIKDTIEEAMSFQKLKGGLGEAFLYRLKGDRAHNLEMAIKYFNDSLLTYLLIRDEVSFAPLWNQLGITYFERIAGDKKDNLERAIEYYNHAITDEEPGTFYWHAYHLNLGNAYRERIAGEPANNQTEAIKNLQIALEKITIASNPDVWARCQHSLGNLYRKMRGESNVADIQKAIEHYQNAIEARKQTNDFYALGQSYLALGSAYLAIEKGNPEPKFERSANALMSASELISTDIDPRVSMNIFYELGSIYYQQENWALCVDTLEKAHQALESLRNEIFSEVRRQDLSIATSDLYNKLVGACLKLNNIESAFNYTSAAKSRSLLDHLNAPADTVPSLIEKNTELANAWTSISALRKEIDNKVLVLQSPGQSMTSDKNQRQVVYNDIKKKRRQLQQELEAAFFSFPQLSSVTVAQAITLSQAKQLSANLLQSPLIEYYSTGEGWHAFVVTASDCKVVSLPSPAEDIISSTSRWLTAYEKGESWAIKKMPDVLSSFHASIFQPVQDCLPQSSHLMIAPYLGLHSLPFELCRTPQGKYLGDEYTISYTPGLSILNQLYEQQSQLADEANQKRLLTVVYSASDSKVPLRHVLEEAKDIKPYFSTADSVYLEEVNALPDLVINACNEKQFDVIHIACHANFDMNDPLNSGLLLANGSILSVERVQTEMRLKQKPLVVLSACETGHNSARSADENLGLVQSFFAAGAGAVIASFWNVNDESTKQLFVEFYKRKTDDESFAKTLNEAKNVLRKDARWQQPFFWSAFRFSGLPFSKSSLVAATKTSTSITL